MSDRSRGSRWLALLVALLVLAPFALAAADEIRESERQLEETQRQEERAQRERDAKEAALEEARQDLHHASERVAQAQAELAAIEVRLEDAQADLDRLESELEVAIEEHKRASDRVDAVTRQLVIATRRLEAVEQQLAERKDAFESRVAATYKYGTVTYAQVLVDSRDFEEFLTSYYYVRSAMGHDQTVVDEIASLTRELASRQAEISQLRDVARDEQAKAESARDLVAELAAEQRQATEQIAAERDRQEVVTAELQAAQQDYETQVDTLERESNELEAELKALASDRASIEAEIERMRAQRASAGAGASGSGNCQAGYTPRDFAWPTNGCVTSGYGYRHHPIYGTQRMHTGIDVPGPTGQAIYSATEGYVVSAGWRGGYGLTVVVDHGGGVATLYGHMSAVSVSAGQFVGHAQQVGQIGTTGQSTGPHLHFEVRVNGSPQDPMNWY